MMYFKLELDHCIDIITNSSSELFILKGATKELVKEAIKEVYPDYLDEYQEVKSLSDLNEYELENYLNSSIGYGVDYDSAMTSLIDGFEFDEMYRSRESYGGIVEYYLKGDFVKINKDKIIEELNKDSQVFLLYSHQDNPNWGWQEQLMTIGSRHHLG